MSKSSISALGQRIVLNATVLAIPHAGNQNLVLINGTVIQVRLREPYRDSQLNELLYVIIVIVFYATALMTLIVTQIKRQRREGTEIDYYDEYLQRNSEVKSTCRAANSIVTRTRATHSPRVTTALASAAVAAASAGSILGTPLNGDEAAGRLLNEKDLEGGGGGGGDGSGVGFGGSGDGGFAGPGRGYVQSGAMTLHGLGTGSLTTPGRWMFSRDKSPTFVLESIPDEEV